MKYGIRRLSFSVDEVRSPNLIFGLSNEQTEARHTQQTYRLGLKDEIPRSQRGLFDLQQALDIGRRLLGCIVAGLG
jgi:hypothetical protein